MWNGKTVKPNNSLYTDNLFILALLQQPTAVFIVLITWHYMKTCISCCFLCLFVLALKRKRSSLWIKKGGSHTCPKYSSPHPGPVLIIAGWLTHRRNPNESWIESTNPFITLECRFAKWHQMHLICFFFLLLFALVASSLFLGGWRAVVQEYQETPAYIRTLLLQTYKYGSLVL